MDTDDCLSLYFVCVVRFGCGGRHEGLLLIVVFVRLYLLL